MKRYERATRKIIELFLEGRISLPECRAALSVAFADVFARLDDRYLDSLRLLLMANEDILIKEIQRRKRPIARSSRTASRVPVRPTATSRSSV